MATTYMINKKKLTHDEHKKIAKDLGGDLVCIVNQQEQTMVETLMKNSNITNAWIGAHRKQEGAQKGPGHWKWDDGSVWKYTKWAQGEPQAKEKFVKLRIDAGWEDHDDHHASAVYKIPKTQYIANPKKMTFDEHRAYADKNGMALVSIHNEAENEVVRKLAHIQDLGDKFWIGGEKRGSNFVWVDDSSWDYTNWEQNHPDNGQNGKTIMSANGKWHDATKVPAKKELKELYTYVGEGGCHNDTNKAKQDCRNHMTCQFVGQQSNGCWHKLKQDNDGKSVKSTYTRGFFNVKPVQNDVQDTVSTYDPNNPPKLGAVYMITSLYKKQYEAAESKLVKTNALIDDYNYELYEKETKKPGSKAKRIEGFAESFIEGNTSGGGLERSEQLHDKVIQELDSIITYNKTQTELQDAHKKKYSNFLFNLRNLNTSIQDDIEIETTKFKTSMKDKIIYMDYENGLFDNINDGLDGSVAHNNSRRTYYQSQQMDSLKFINQKILFWIYTILVVIYGIALQYTDTKTEYKVLYISMFVLFPFVAYYIEYYLFRLIQYVYRNLNRNAYSNDNF